MADGKIDPNDLEAIVEKVELAQNNVKKNGWSRTAVALTILLGVPGVSIPTFGQDILKAMTKEVVVEELRDKGIVDDPRSGIVGHSGRIRRLEDMAARLKEIQTRIDENHKLLGELVKDKPTRRRR